MIELTIYGRGGQGGVTLAKLIATTYFLRGKHVQAFGVYAAERSGAPLQAYVRVDDTEITNHNHVRRPDHVIVLDRTLIGPNVLTGLDLDGWVILNTAEMPADFAQRFGGRRVATVDATSIAVECGLGTRAVPIVNTTVLGAVARTFELSFDDVEASLRELNFTGPNLDAARRAYDCVRTARLPGPVAEAPQQAAAGRAAGLFDDVVGSEPRIRTGTWATHQPHRRRLTPPCNGACPAGNDVQGFVAAVGRECHDEALDILLETSPFPGVCGRVCPAPCMDVCNRNLFDEGVNVRELERYAAEHGRAPEPRGPTREERIAIVGSGPAGLSAAYALGRLGYPVTLFEADDELGGVMRTGIPAYRLPRSVLDGEIDYIVAHGVTVRTGERVDQRGIHRLTHEFEAVFVGTGLQHLRGLNVGDALSDRVVQGIEFLNRAREEAESFDGEDVVVVGGGNTAMDAARTALRLGARHVRVVYRRTRAEMPAIAEEIEEAVEEGVQIDELLMPLHLDRDGATHASMGAVLTCQRMRLGEPDESGRPRPVPEVSEDAFFDLRCDRLILALGQSTDLSILPAGSEVHDGEAMVGLSGAPVFAGGDFATNEGTVAAAIGSGRRAALHIHRTLTGEDLFPPDPEPAATPERIVTHVFAHAPRERGGEVPAWMRRRSFVEVRTGFDDGDARQATEEARRCFSCGVCNECDRCVTHCPEGILVRDGDGYRFDYDYCKGCGVCAVQCPRGVIYMAEL